MEMRPRESKGQVPPRFWSITDGAISQSRGHLEVSSGGPVFVFFLSFFFGGIGG
jgi:hypothetical protein